MRYTLPSRYCDSDKLLNFAWQQFGPLTYGLDTVRAILTSAGAHLRPGGILVVEVGNSERALLQAFPRVPFVWPQFHAGGGGVFLLHAKNLGVD